MYNEIKQHIVNKGDVRSPVSHYELYDMHGCYEKSKPNLTGFGGKIMQIYYCVSAILAVSEEEIMEHYIRAQADPENELLKKAHSPRELLLERYFLPFMCNFIKEMKADYIPILIPPQLQAEIDAFGLPKSGAAATAPPDLSKMTFEQYIVFRYHFVDKMLDSNSLKSADNRKALELILESLCMIVTRRVP